MKLYQTRPKLPQIISLARGQGYRVRRVSRKLGPYAGMNPQAAKLLGFKGCPRNTLLIDKNQSERKQCQTLKHEIIEPHRIKIQTPRQCTRKPYSRYLLAHRYAENHENDSLAKIREILARH